MTSSVMRRLCSSSASASAGAANRTMWYEPSRNRSIGIGEAPAAPRGDLDDLTATGGDLAGDAVDDRLALVVRDVGTDHEHEFVSAHARSHSFQWVCPVDVGRADAARSGKETGRSLARPSCGLEQSPTPADVSSAATPRTRPLLRTQPEAPCPPAPSSSSKAPPPAIASLPFLSSAPATPSPQTTDPDEAFAKIVEHQLAI